MKSIFKLNILFLFVYFISCTTAVDCPEKPQQLISEYQAYVKDVKNTDRFYSSKQWEAKEKQHKKLIEDCYPSIEPHMNSVQEETLWSSVIEYYLFRHKGNIETIFDQSVPQYALLQSKIKTIWPDPYVAFEQIFKHATDKDFKEILESMQKEIVN